MPHNGRLLGLGVALLVTATLAALAPAAPGVNVTLNAQLLPAGRLLGPNEHGVAPVGDTVKSVVFGPVTAIPVIFSAALPLLVLVRVTV